MFEDMFSDSEMTAITVVIIILLVALLVLRVQGARRGKK
jgi:hypothetical protein